MARNVSLDLKFRNISVLQLLKFDYGQFGLLQNRLVEGNAALMECSNLARPFQIEFPYKNRVPGARFGDRQPIDQAVQIRSTVMGPRDSKVQGSSSTLRIDQDQRPPGEHNGLVMLFMICYGSF